MPDKEKGQTLIEILVAVAIITVAMVAVVARTVEAVRNANFARNQSLATRFAQEGVEWARIQRDSLRWSNFEAVIQSASPVTYCVPDLELELADVISVNCDPASEADNIAGTVFDRQVSFNFVEDLTGNGDYVEVEVIVNWQDSIGGHRSKLDTRLSEWVY